MDKWMLLHSLAPFAYGCGGDVCCWFGCNLLFRWDVDKHIRKNDSRFSPFYLFIWKSELVMSQAEMKMSLAIQMDMAILDYIHFEWKRQTCMACGNVFEANCVLEDGWCFEKILIRALFIKTLDTQRNVAFVFEIAFVFQKLRNQHHKHIFMSTIGCFFFCQNSSQVELMMLRSTEPK